MYRKPRIGVLIVTLVCAGGVLSGATASNAAAPAAGGTTDVIVGFEPGTTTMQAARTLQNVAGAATNTLADGARVVRVARTKVASTIAALRARPDVRYAEPDGIVHAVDVTPNDPSYSELWGMTKIGAPVAWANGTGDGTAVVAIIDTGIDASHPDLAPNVWKNPGGIWGCPANTYGYDVVNNDCTPNDDHYHGTHVAGTIGAVGNNGIGVAGVNWNVKIMALKVLDATGSGSDVGVAAGIDKAVEARQAGVNVRVISASLGGAGTSTAMQDAINRATAAGIVFVAAAGNSAANVDTNAFAPCIYATLCVAATDSTDQRASFSNYGPATVDIAAPGVGILSTEPGGGYQKLSGTSMATPHVSGAIALLAQTGLCRNMTATQLVSLVLNQSDIVSGLNIAGNRRLDIGRAMASCGSPTPVSALTNGVYVRNLSGGTGSDRFYRLTVPAGRTKVVFGLGNGTGNADLYVQVSAPPSLTSYKCRSIRTTNAESCTITKPAAGDYYVMIHGTTAYTKLSLHGVYSPK